MTAYIVFHASISEDLDGGWSASVAENDVTGHGKNEDAARKDLRANIANLTGLNPIGFAIEYPA